MSDWGFVISGWIATVGILGGYGTYVLWRGRRLSAQVPADRRRWMSAPEEAR